MSISQGFMLSGGTRLYAHIGLYAQGHRDLSSYRASFPGSQGNMLTLTRALCSHTGLCAQDHRALCSHSQGFMLNGVAGLHAHTGLYAQGHRASCSGGVICSGAHVRMHLDEIM